MGELDFVIADGSYALPIEVKSGKDYKRHNALNNILECREYDIPKAYVLCNENITKIGEVINLPVYMTIFIRPKEIENGRYTVDISALK